MILRWYHFQCARSWWTKRCNVTHYGDFI